MIISHWGAVAIPTVFLSIIAIFIIGERFGQYPSLTEVMIYLGFTGLVLLWYTLIQLLASSWAEDMGSSLALGLGAWMLFTLLWLLLTSVVAGLSGVAVDGSDVERWSNLQAQVDLFSPNGLYHLALETQIQNIDRRNSTFSLVMATCIWTFVPWYLLARRVKSMQP